MLFADWEEPEAALVDQAEDVEGKLTPEEQMGVVLPMKAELKVNEKNSRSLMAKLPRSNSQVKRFRKEFDENKVKSNDDTPRRVTGQNGVIIDW
ncbi:hypothetical protein N7463_010015 [Penicillium fimorum]|uniref:Uncharacterized protein n=1 Tax=Penicillium fimorum TaxID=1882269 RepID=A0A9X0C0V2_9EURO|nr:hypothetical protein N7463_010015 [Penicillium fimorum]